MSQSQVTQSCDIEKIIEDFKTDDIIWYSNSMLALWIVCNRNSIEFSYITQYKSISFIYL